MYYVYLYFFTKYDRLIAGSGYGVASPLLIA